MSPLSQQSLLDWRPNPPSSYLIPTGERRRRCYVYQKNPNWNGFLKSKPKARLLDPDTSHLAAASINIGDILEARSYVDAILSLGLGVISIELREFVLAGIANRSIDPLGLPANVRAESIRRRFSDLCL